MDGAHLHLAINHLPIVGALIGFLVLLTGVFIKSPQVKYTALGIFIFSALTSVAVFYTGKRAEGIVGNIPGISETLIHQHEEYAELFFTTLLILGGIALITLFLEIRKAKIANYGFIAMLLLSIATMVMAGYVGTSGGGIRHAEIRNEANFIQIETEVDGDRN